MLRWWFSLNLIFCFTFYAIAGRDGHFYHSDINPVRLSFEMTHFFAGDTIGKEVFRVRKYMKNPENLIVNGSFEDGPPVNTYITLRAGETLPGWRVIRETIDLNKNYMDAADGDRCIDLNGTPGIGSIQTSFFTKKGRNYLLRFYMAGNPNGPPDIKKMKVSAGSQSEIFEFDISNHTAKNMGWQRKEMIFKATARKTFLTFESLTDYYVSNYGPALDAVSVVPTHKPISEKGDGPKGHLAGFTYGICGGISDYFINNQYDIYNLPSGYDYFVSSANPGFHAGLFAIVRVGRVMFQPEVVLTQHEVRYDVQEPGSTVINWNARERFQFIDVPVLIGYSPYQSFWKLFIGPSGQFIIGSQSDFKKRLALESSIPAFAIAYQAGIGFTLGHINLDLRYEGNFRWIDRMVSGDLPAMYSIRADRVIATVGFAIY